MRLALWGEVTADFNRDGKLDLAVTDNATGHVSVLLGNGDGTFHRGRGFASVGALGLATGDLNGDGIADLVVGSTTDFIYVYLGNGDGTFRPSRHYVTGRSPIGVVIADFNGDGHPDVAVANSNDINKRTGSLSVYSNRGDGTLDRAIQYPMAGRPIALTAADLNGDGHLDLAVARIRTDATDSLAIMLNTGDGTFTNNANYSVGIEAANVAAGDLNHDGINDLAVSSDGQVIVLLGNGNATFGSQCSYATTSLGQGEAALVIADFNLDGNPDIAFDLANGIPVANSGLLYGNGDGTFQGLIAINPNANGSSSLVVGDFDGDGAPDLAMPIAAKSKVAVILNTQ